MAEHTLPLNGPASSVEGDLSLPTPPGVIRRFWARHPWCTDSLVTAVYIVPAFFGSLSITALEPATAGVLGVFGPLLTLTGGGAVLFRRRVPLTALAASVAIIVITFPAYGGFNAIPVVLILYAVAVYRSTRLAWIGLAGSAAVLVAAALIPWPAPPGGINPSQPATSYIILMLVAVLIGVNVGNRKRYVAALVDRAAQLARERDQQALLAAATERARIAREMHDIVSHSLTVMVSLADGSAALAVRSPERATAAMRQVAETGRHALADMRRMLGLLHDSADDATPEADLTPQPGANDLARLVHTFRSAGLPVRLTVSGLAPDDPGQQLIVYRIVQESLTNALRYATATTLVTVTVTFTEERISVAVEDDGAGSNSRQSGAGRGLLGMAQRVALYGGTLESGPRPARGWQVLARFSSTGGDTDHRTGDAEPTKDML